MKKFLTLSLSFLLAFFLCACSDNSNSQVSQNANQSTQSNEPLVITFWHYYGDSVQSKLNLVVDSFNETIGKENNIEVVAIAKPSISELEVELTKSATGVVYADEMPSMFLAYADKILELQELGVISDLNDFFSLDDKSFLIDDFLQVGVINGEQVMMPLVKSTELTFLNQTHWDEFSSLYNFTDENLLTWEGILEVCKVYYEHTDNLTPDILNDGKALFGMDSLQNFITVASYQLGFDIFDPTLKVANFDIDTLRAIFNYYIEVYTKGYFDDSGKFRTDDMRSGDILGFASSSASFIYIPDWIENDNLSQEDIVWKSLPYPHFEGSTPYVLSQGAGIAISKISTEQQEACVMFLNHFYNYNIDFAIDTAYIPVVNEFLESTSDDLYSFFETKNLEANEINTYELVISQIKNDLLYQPVAFEGSYIIRTELAKAFELYATNIRKLAEEHLASGVLREDLLDSLNIDEYFDSMMLSLSETLASKGIN